MKQITDKEYKDFQKYKQDMLYGRLITSDSLRLICEANNNDPEAIGKHMLNVVMRIKEYEKKLV